MKTPKEKAQELVDKYRIKFPYSSSRNKLAKQCAMIAVDEIIESINWINYNDSDMFKDFWQQVKQEIQAL